MRIHLHLALFALAASGLAHAAGSGANPSATYCYNGGTVGAIGGSGGGSGGGGGAACTYGNPTSSFGPSYTTTQVSGLAQTACALTSPDIAAQHLFATGHATSFLQPPSADDDQFLLKSGETPAAIIALDTSDALNDFSTMPDVPPSFTSGPGAGRPMGCPSTVMESKLHRAWAAFGNSYYYGSPEASAISDPSSFRYFACWQPITLGVNQAYLYRRWANPQSPQTQCAASVGNNNSFDYYQCVWCVSHGSVTVPDPQSWNGSTTTRNTSGSGHGYYITSNAKDTTNKSVYWSGAVIDYPPMWLPIYWVGKFMANNSMRDLSGTKFLFPLRREIATFNNNMPPGACGTATDSGGNGMHPTCGRSNPYRGDSSFNSIWSFLDTNKFKPFLEGTPVGKDLPLAGGIAELAEKYRQGGFQPSGNTAGWCSTCTRNRIIVLSAGETCHDQGTGAIDSFYYDPSVACTGACAHTEPSCAPRSSSTYLTCGGAPAVWPPQVASKISTTDMLSATPGTQTITVDAIAIGNNQGALRDAARVSGGTFVDASDDPHAIPEALFSVLNGLIRASVSTASTPLNTVQAQGGAQEELVPQFVPLENESIYEGHLYKLYFFSEFAAGCLSPGQSINFPDPSSTSTIQCPCLGGSCNGRFSVDANQDFVLRANDGTLRVLSYAQLTAFYSANNRLPTAQEMISYPLFVPVWDMATIMEDTSRHPWYGRTAYTVIDSNSDRRIDASDGLMQISTTSSGVTDAVAQALLPYLGVLGTDLCSQIAGLSIGVPDPAMTGNYLPCAKAVLNYALGQDLFDNDLDGQTNDNRTPMLGDIYHSTPIDIGPPVQEQFCDFNLRRCTATLFNINNQQDSTDYQALEYPATYYDDHGVLTTGPGIDAYQAWANDQIFRQGYPHVRVFGANDGWIHAIQYACYTGVGGVNREATYYGGPGNTGC